MQNGIASNELIVDNSNSGSWNVRVPFICDVKWPGHLLVS